MSLRATILAGLAILGIGLLAVWQFAPSVFAEARSLAGIVCFWPEKSADIELSVDGRRVGEPNGVGPLR